MKKKIPTAQVADLVGAVLGMVVAVAVEVTRAGEEGGDIPSCFFAFVVSDSGLFA